MRKQGRLWWQFKGGGWLAGKLLAPSFFLATFFVLFFSFSVAPSAAEERLADCPPCHFYSKEGGGRCIPVPEGSDPYNDCGGGDLAPRLFCGVEKVCGKNAVCQLRAQPSCDCNFKSGVCVAPPPPPPPPVLSDPEPEPTLKFEPDPTPLLELEVEEAVKSPLVPDSKESAPNVFIVELRTDVLICLTVFIALGPAIGVCLLIDAFRRKRGHSKKIMNFDLESNYNSAPTEPSEQESSGRKGRRKSVRKWESVVPEGDDSDTEDNV